LKFTYQYKTSDGVRHSGVHAARSREAVYDELRAKGIKAFGVEPAPASSTACPASSAGGWLSSSCWPSLWS
jgi:type II secretory pathway component PulF